MGRTVFDNKGNPIKTYEPFFASTSDYESEAASVEQGTTPILRYDPLGRLIRTDFPDGTLARVVFTPWRQEAWDPNDCVSESTWLDRMQAGTTAEQRAAALALAHAGTPNVAHLDVLGRAFLRVADAGGGGIRATRIALDVEGNTRTTTDPRGIVVAANTYAPLGRLLRAVMPDAGESHALADVAGQPIRSWSARGFRHRYLYDALRRPTHVFSLPLDGSAESLVERIAYGESLPALEATVANARGHAVRVFDSSGVLASTSHDFKGNVLGSLRRLAHAYDIGIDWTPLASHTEIAGLDAAAAPILSADPDNAFTTSVVYDALGRVTASTTPDGSTTTPTYNEANLLERVDIRLRGAPSATPVITGVDYNARGQRIRVGRANGTTTTYSYDALTHRVSSLRTTRDASGFVLQDHAYTYDAVGNIVETRDAVGFGNGNVSADGRYEYDPLYQLTEASGREHPGQQPTGSDPALRRLDHPADLQSLRRYREVYAYDVVGNITSMAHVPMDGATGWTRRYEYAAASNRLQSTSLPSDVPGTFSAVYTHDDHGNMTSMPHLAVMRWDHADHLISADLGGGGTVHFTYDSTGQRVRKVHVHGGFREERIYLGGFEVYRKHNASTGDTTLVRETLHVMDDQSRVALIDTKTSIAGPASTPVSLLRYQVANHLGSSAFELDDAAGVIAYEEYFAYGGTAFHAADAAADVPAKRYRYVGLERDDETGLDYASARYYSSWLGRWTAADPIGLQGGSNQFLYCANDPINRTDLEGTDWSWLNPRNWCNPFDSDCEVVPVEIAKGFGKAAYHLGRDTAARSADLTTMLVSTIGTATGWYDVGYTEWSPEAQNYDPKKNWKEQSRANLYNNTVGGVVSLAKGVASGDPQSIGAALFIAVLAKASGGRGGSRPPPGLSLRVPVIMLARMGSRTIPVIATQTVAVAATIPASVALAGNVGAAMMATNGGGGGGAGGNTGGGSGGGSPGVIAKNLGGKNPIPKGTSFALGMGKTLARFTASLKSAVNIGTAYDLNYVRGWFADPEVFRGAFPELLNTFIENGGRIKFDLTGLSPLQEGMTTWELRGILKSETWTTATDFFLDGRPLTGSKLEAALKPWR